MHDAANAQSYKHQFLVLKHIIVAQTLHSSSVIIVRQIFTAYCMAVASGPAGLVLARLVSTFAFKIVHA